MTNNSNDEIVLLTADIVSAYVANNPVPLAELSGLISLVHGSLSNVGSAEVAQLVEPQKPAVNPKRSVFDDHIVCLEDGKKFKSLKRHLSSHGMSPEEYRKKWNLPADYPMVAPAYAQARSDLAKQMGLGRKPSAAPKEAPAFASAPAKRGRPKKTES